MENQMEEKKEQKSRGPGKRAFGFLFLLSLLLAAMASVGLLFLWAWISYHRRFSAELVRAGLIFLYILPCMLGSRLLCLGRHSYLPLWGALLGGLFYGLLCLCSFLVRGSAFSYDSLEWTTPLLCVCSGMIGAFRSRGGKNRQENRKSVRNE